MTENTNKMLIEYGLRNFLCFKEGASVSFRLDGNVPEHISNGFGNATIMCVKGANGSGKTHLLKGLAFMASFASKSFSGEPEADIAVDSYCRSSSPSEFYAEFTAEDGITYLYELSVTPERVIREALYQKKKRQTKLFERNLDKVKAVNRLSDIEAIDYRKNASIISTLHQHRNKEFEPVHSFFKKIIFNVTQSGFIGAQHFDTDTVSKFFAEDPKLLAIVIDFIKQCDIGIADITISSEEGREGKKKYFPIFHHMVDDKTFPVFSSTESSGTKYLYRILSAYITTIARGGVFIADEFDIYLHPDLLPKLTELFTDKNMNQLGAQLLFSAHDADILDICGKYRTCLVNKDNNASYVYRLDELPGDILRNDRPISPLYKEGRIGGVPRL